MRILNICMGAPFSEQYTYQDNLLSKYQQKHGHDTIVLTTTRMRNEQGKVVNTSSGERVLGNGVTLIRMPAPGKLFQFLGIYKGLYQKIAEIKPDFIFIHGLTSFVPASAIRYQKKNPKVRIVADNHQDEGTTYTKKFPYNIILSCFKMLWKLWIHRVECVYGTTSWRKAFAGEYLGIPENKLDVLIMGIDSDQLPGNSETVRQQVRKELKIGDQEFVFITGGKLDKHKLTLEALRAFHEIVHESARMIVFGSIGADIKSEFEELVMKDDRICYIGYIDSKDVHRYFLASDFGVFPGRHSVLWEEAIGCGLPCIFKAYEEKDHTDVCGNCIRLKDLSQESIYVVLRDVITDQQRYHALKESALHAAEQFSYHAIADKSVEHA